MIPTSTSHHLELLAVPFLDRPRNRLKSDSRDDLIDFSRRPPLDPSPHLPPPADPSISIRLHTHIVVLVVSDCRNTFASTLMVLLFSSIPSNMDACRSSKRR
ncbi:hypothetical protein B0H11DRAFT_2259712 [Mycena galericulata]|nr:hypothetical protein B0H11DRAFT_2262050 [Mycena galericulata]KAJ7433187.1 hypothetical protein B0H11DRAFT_2259712 [Mycena galericulata]